MLDPVEVPMVHPGEHADAPLRLRNVGPGPVTLAGVRVEDDGGAYTVGTWPVEALREGEAAELAVRFTPPADGAWPGRLTVTTTGGAAYPADLDGHAGWGDLVVSTAALDLGPVVPGEPVSASLGVENAGDADLVLESLTLVAGAAGFVVVDPGPFTAPGVPLAPGAGGTVEVAWTPEDEGCGAATLLLRTDDPDTPEVVVDVEGCADAPGAEATLVLNVDDSWEAWLDGEPFDASDAGTWYSTDVLAFDLLPGEHVLALHGTDTGGPGGFIAGLWLDGSWAWGTGDGAARVRADAPEPGWELPEHDDTAWEVEQLCADTSSWGSSQSGGLETWGARWVWSSTDCHTPPEAWFRVHFVVP